MEELRSLIVNNLDWLTDHILEYARDFGYQNYVLAPANSRRASVAGLSKTLLNTLATDSESFELGVETDYSKDPVGILGISEAQKHQERNISLEHFLGFLKYYRQSYVDLVTRAGFNREQEEKSRLFIERFF